MTDADYARLESELNEDSETDVRGGVKESRLEEDGGTEVVQDGGGTEVVQDGGGSEGTSSTRTWQVSDEVFFAWVGDGSSEP